MRLFREIASERGGVVHEPSRSLLSSSHGGALELEVGEAAVYVDSFVGGVGAGRRVTRVRAALLVPDGPKFMVLPRRRGGKRLNIPGGSALSFDDEAFSERFAVVGDGVTTRSVWSDAARDLMTQWFPLASVTCDRRVVTLMCDGELDAAVEFDAAIELVAELVNVDFFGLDELERLPGVRYVPPSGPWDSRTLPYVELLDDPAVTIGPVLTPFAATRAVDAGAEPDERLHLDVAEDGVIVEGLDVPADVVVALRIVGDGVLEVGQGKAEFTWHHIATDMQQLLAGLSIVRSFSHRVQSGPYR